MSHKIPLFDFLCMTHTTHVKNAMREDRHHSSPTNRSRLVSCGCFLRHRLCDSPSITEITCKSRTAYSCAIFPRENLLPKNSSQILSTSACVSVGSIR